VVICPLLFGTSSWYIVPIFLLLARVTHTPLPLIIIDVVMIVVGGVGKGLAGDISSSTGRWWEWLQQSAGNLHNASLLLLPPPLARCIIVVVVVVVEEEEEKEGA